MATITIYGASDDLVEVEIIGKDGRNGFEADAYDRGRSIILRLADGSGMRVYQYRRSAAGNDVCKLHVPDGCRARQERRFLAIEVRI